MHALLHTVCALLVLPYVGLAALFLLIGEAARAKGLLALFDVMLSHANWLVRWGVYAFVLLWLSLVLIGFVTRFQRAASLCLCLLAAASLLVIVALHSSRLELGHLVFLAPCVAVCATSAWLFLRAGGGA